MQWGCMAAVLMLWVSATAEPSSVRPLVAQTGPGAAAGTGSAPADRARTAGSFRVVPGEPETVADPGRALEAPQLLDAKVGDINGRPVFVSAFLEPIESRGESVH